jgi:hypothetical protein
LEFSASGRADDVYCLLDYKEENKNKNRGFTWLIIKKKKKKKRG